MTRDADTETLYRALLAAFPNQGALERMLRFGMGLNLAEIASGNLSDQVFAVINFADARGLAKQLVQSALAGNPDSVDLRAVVELPRYAPNTPPMPPVAGSGGTAAVDKVTLRNVIQETYSLEELHLLCADLQERLRTRGHDLLLSLDDIGGATKPVKILNLIEFLDRRRVLDVLVQTVREQRPGRV